MMHDPIVSAIAKANLPGLLLAVFGVSQMVTAMVVSFRPPYVGRKFWPFALWAVVGLLLMVDGVARCTVAGR
jgi:uncharacterized membrane protein HdeD (DUF308 family)